MLHSDIRPDLQTLLREFGTGRSARAAAQALNRAIPSFAPAYRLQRAHQRRAARRAAHSATCGALLRGQQRVFGALAENPEALHDLVTDLNATAGALASQDAALAAVGAGAARHAARGLPGARRAERRAAHAARVLARGAAGRALVGRRRSTPRSRGSSQARGAGQRGRAEGAGRGPAPGRAEPGEAQPAAWSRRCASCARCPRAPTRCWCRSSSPAIPSIEAGNSGQAVREQIMRSFVGLAGESRVHDANTPVFHVQGVSPLNLTGGRSRAGRPARPEHAAAAPARTCRARRRSRPTCRRPAARRSTRPTRR